MKYGTSLDGLSDLTGGIAESIPLRPTSPELSATLGHLLKLTTIVLAKVDDGNRDKSAEINEVPFEYLLLRLYHSDFCLFIASGTTRYNTRRMLSNFSLAQSKLLLAFFTAKAT